MRNEQIILPFAPNFQKFLENKGNLEARVTELPEHISQSFRKNPSIYRRSNFAVYLNGKRIGGYVVIGREDSLLLIGFRGVIPDYRGNQEIILAACFENFGYDGVPQKYNRVDGHSDIPFL